MDAFNYFTSKIYATFDTTSVSAVSFPLRSCTENTKMNQYLGRIRTGLRTFVQLRTVCKGVICSSVFDQCVRVTPNHTGTAQAFRFPQQCPLAWETESRWGGYAEDMDYVIHFTCYLLGLLSEYFLFKLYVIRVEKVSVVWMEVPDLHLY